MYTLMCDTASSIMSQSHSSDSSGLAGCGSAPSPASTRCVSSIYKITFVFIIMLYMFNVEFMHVSCYIYSDIFACM